MQFKELVAKLKSQPENFRRISTDSRSLNVGDIFIALKGENFDAHDFIEQVLDSGAAYVVSEIEHNDERVVVVEDTLLAYHELAQNYRQLVNPITIAVTGSSGKTTTKEMLAGILQKKYRLHATEKNFNNEYGVPKTILAMPLDTELLVLEMGMRGLGQIELLSKTAQPNIAVITNIGVAHIEILGSRENIKKAKLEIVAGLCVYKSPDKKLDQLFVVDEKLYADISQQKEKFPTMRVFDFSSRYQLNGLVSPGVIADANAAAVVAKYLGLEEDEIKSALLDYKAADGRGKFYYAGENIIIDDSYNANPESLKSSLEGLLQQFPQERKILVMGELKESTQKYINKVEDFIVQAQQEHDLILIDARKGPLEEVSKKLQALLNDGVKSVALLKASRASRLELLLDDLALQA